MSNYDKEYSRKLITSQKAIEKIKNSSTIVLPPGPGAPLALMAAIADRARSGDLKDIKIYTLFPMEQAHKTYLSPDLCDCIQTYSWFATGADRSFIKVGLDYYVPNYYHQIPRLIRDFMQIDVTMTAVSPMDKAGYFTLGLSNDYTSTAARHCKKLIVEVNENMPRVFGDSLIHVSEVDAIIENTGPLPVVVPADPMPEDDIIGKFVIEMVPDGATIQLGWGNIPNTIARYLTNHKDLGIHTELLGPGIIDLIKKGVVTGRKKNLHPRKSVFTNAIGTQSMYEFMNDNPGIESYPVSYINNPDTIAKNDNMFSINAILEVDLLGQCNSEYLEGTQFSGTGGQLDYVRGAFNSKGGKSILAFYSTAHNEQISRIVPRLETGAVVTTPRMDTHYLVTEYGAVNLKGRSTRERALDIISIAHPKFRDSLIREAENMFLI